MGIAGFLALVFSFLAYLIWHYSDNKAQAYHQVGLTWLKTFGLLFHQGICTFIIYTLVKFLGILFVVLQEDLIFDLENGRFFWFLVSGRWPLWSWDIPIPVCSFRTSKRRNLKH